MSVTGSPLATRYRRLLWCYPRDYRHQRGQEIVGTLLDLAPAGRAWPTARQAANLVRHGLRCRLGRPASRSVVIWAVLTSLVWGLFIAAFASRAGWETARPLPTVAEATAIFSDVLPDENLAGRVHRSPAMFVVYGQPLTLQNVNVLFFGDGGEYEFGTTRGTLDGPADERRAPGAVMRRLRSNGWEVAEPRTENAVECAISSCDPDTLPTKTFLTARRGSDIIEIEIYPSAGSNETNVSMNLQRATPWSVCPASLVGGVLGVVIGWLVFGWASRRSETRNAALRLVTNAFYGFAMVLWWLPIIVASSSALAHHVDRTHFRWHPLWEWLGQPVGSLLFLIGTGMALVVFAVAALPRRKPGHATDVATR
jgi:hypothetical protein